MKLPTNLNIAKLTFISILLIALSSGCFFAGKNWNIWFPAVAENPLPPAPQPVPEGENSVITPTNGEQYTDFEYKGKVYRVEKSLLTEAGSKYNTNNRFYRFLNGNWEMKEGTDDAKWKTATLISDITITLILTNWDAKFRGVQPAPTPPVTTPPVTTPPVTTPPVPSPPKDLKPRQTPPTEIPKVTPPTKKILTSEEKAQKFEEIKAQVRAGNCNAGCIFNKVEEFQLSPVQSQKLFTYLP